MLLAGIIWCVGHRLFFTDRGVRDRRVGVAPTHGGKWFNRRTVTANLAKPRLVLRAMWTKFYHFVDA